MTPSEKSNWKAYKVGDVVVLKSWEQLVEQFGYDAARASIKLGTLSWQPSDAAVHQNYSNIVKIEQINEAIPNIYGVDEEIIFRMVE